MGLERTLKYGGIVLALTTGAYLVGQRFLKTELPAAPAAASAEGKPFWVGPQVPRILLESYEPTLADRVHEQAKELSSDHWRVAYLKRSSKIDASERGIVVFNDRRYDLSNGSDLGSASALVGLERVAYGAESNMKANGFELGEEVREPIRALEGLEGRIKFEAREDRYESAAPSYPVLVRTLDVLSKAGKSLPEVLRFARGKSEYDPQIGALTVSTINPADLTALYRVADPDFFQEYTRRVDEAFASLSDPIRNLHLASFDRLGFQDSNEKDFAKTFEAYFSKGDSFRRKIAYAEVTGHVAEAALLKARYQAIKDWVGGVETSDNGRIKPQGGDYRRGDVVAVHDPEPLRPGVFLSVDPKPGLNNRGRYVVEGDRLSLESDAMLQVDHERMEAFDMYKVLKVESMNGRNWVPVLQRGARGELDSRFLIQGYLAADYFGKIVESGQ